MLVALTTAAPAAVLEWRPVSATGAHTIVGNEIVLQGGGQQVTLEVYISDWDPNLDGDPELGAYQVTLDSSGYTSGSGAALSPLTSPNAAAGAFFVLRRCTVGQQPSSAGANCTTNPGICPGGEFCIDNQDFILTGHQPLTGIFTGTLDYEYGAAVQTLNGKVDGGLSYYAATLIVVVPAGAQGTYTLNFLNDPNRTFLLDIDAITISPLEFVPAQISIACATSADCNDGNACTQDICEANQTCSNPPNYNPATQCCNPANGATVPLTDNNVCTDDVCDENTGVVTHPPVVAGTACGNPNSTQCDAPDTCNGAGVCQTNLAPAGTACGDPSSTPCDQPDSCNGLGQCLNNRLPAGSPCGDQTDNDCTDPDTCTAAGVCQANNVPNNTPCDDGQFCTVGERCTAGVCGGGTPRDCNDNLPCTTDVCNETTKMCENNLDPGNCLIAGVCYGEGQRNPANTCEECNTGMTVSDWTLLPDGTVCDDGNPCTGTGAPGVGLDTCDANGVCSGEPDPECNDTCDNAVQVFEGVNSGFSNTAASPTDDAEASCQPDSNGDIWFVYNASCTGPVLVTTTDSAFAPSDDSVLSVYDACGGNEIACDDDSGVGLHAALVFNGVFGTDYFIRVAGFEDNAGSVVVNISTVADCVIDGVCYAEDDVNPDNDCEVCLPDVSTSSWSPRLEGTPCGDFSSGECDNPDACDGFGFCEPNHKPDGLACSDEGNECTFDQCLAGACDHPPVPSGTLCGDPTNNECDNPDTCDPVGNCQPNFEPFGTSCGDPFDDQCDNPDICDGGGLCDPNFELTGTPCDDADICTGDDVCDLGLCAGVAIPTAPTVLSVGPKAFSISANPPGSVSPVALRVTSPDWPCLLKYVQANGTLNDNPVFQLPVDWDTIIITGGLIVPSSEYVVEAECGAFLSDPDSATTCLWGDIDCNGVVNFTDIQVLILGFQGNFTPGIPFEAMDIDPCSPQGVLNFTDIQRTILAFLGQTYAETGCPVPCP